MDHEDGIQRTSVFQCKVDSKLTKKVLAKNLSVVELEAFPCVCWVWFYISPEKTHSLMSFIKLLVKVKGKIIFVDSILFIINCLFKTLAKSKEH